MQENIQGTEESGPSGVYKNGKNDRTREIFVSRILGGLTMCFLALCFIAPAFLPENSIPELSGRANAIDYAFENSWGNKNHGENSAIGHNRSLHGGSFAWSELSPIWALVYAIGDLNCHQKHQRSWEVNGNQMPVCVRDIGIFAGFLVGCTIFLRRGLNRWTIRDTFLSVFPDSLLSSIYERDLRLVAVFSILFIGLTPMALDGFTQLLLSSYESTNPLRLFTGFGAGFVAGLWFCSAFSARSGSFSSPEMVGLPAGAKLSIK